MGHPADMGLCGGEKERETTGVRSAAPENDVEKLAMARNLRRRAGFVYPTHADDVAIVMNGAPGMDGLCDGGQGRETAGSFPFGLGQGQNDNS